MKRKKIILCLGVLTGVALAVCLLRPWGSRPFQMLRSEEISSATVTLTPPDETLPLSPADIEQLTAILQSCVIYRRDDSYGMYAGQGVRFTLTKKDGATVDVMAYNPFLVIAGTGYRTQYAPCQQLSALGNAILNERR